MPIGVMVLVGGHAELPQVVGTMSAARGLAGCLNGRQQQRDQDADDRNHDQQLDKRKTMLGADLATARIRCPYKIKTAMAGYS